MNLIDVLMLKYPEADFFSQIQIRDSGNGQEIVHWGLDAPLPTAEDIAQWEVQYAQTYIFKCNKIANQSIYNQLDALDTKSIRALRVNDVGRLQQLEDEAAALRAQLLPVS